jgi:hypothetical protein
VSDLNAYTVWCKGGKVGTYRSREKAEQVLRAIASHPLEYLHIQTWQPGDHYDYVTFDDTDQEDIENRSH